MSTWEDTFKEAKAALDAGSLYDGVTAINQWMLAYGEQNGDKDAEILKTPDKFIKEFAPKLDAEAKERLVKMYELRGDLIAGLGAHKRACIDYAAAQSLCAEPSERLRDKIGEAEDAVQWNQEAKEKVPVTVITGFLGAGKTTLLNHILKENHGKRIGVIENEFGEVGIDDGLIETNPMTTEENIIEMNNGCICCTVRGDLIAGLKKMVKNAKQSGKKLDAVIIETTGLADPAPVAQTFLMDDIVQQNFTLDGILCLADAKHLIMHLDEEKPEGVENESVEQVAFADRVLLNKTDLVNEDELGEVEKRIHAINSAVRIQRTQYSKVDMDFILGIQAFSLDRILEMDDAFLDDNADHQHDDRVSSIGIIYKGEVDGDKINEFFGWLFKERGNDLFRTKGIFAIKDSQEKFVFQAVHMAFSGKPAAKWGPDEERTCKLTLIGKNLNREEVEKGFEKCKV